MKSYKQQLLDYLKGWHNSIYRFNTSGAVYYGATFYKRNAWDGEFFWKHEQDEALEKCRYVIDLSTMEFIKG